MPFGVCFIGTVSATAFFPSPSPSVASSCQPVACMIRCGHPNVRMCNSYAPPCPALPCSVRQAYSEPLLLRIGSVFERRTNAIVRPQFRVRQGRLPTDEIDTVLY